MTDDADSLDYYFDDKAPDGWHEYHLQILGPGTPQLWRDEKPIRDVLDTKFVKENKLLEDNVLQVLRVFVRNAGIPLNRLEDFEEFGDIQPYVGRLRKLFNDSEKPHRVITKAGTGALVFALPVRSTPPKHWSIYRDELRHHWKPRAMGSGALFQSGQWYFSGRTKVLREILDWLVASSSEGRARVVTGAPGAGKSAILGYLVTCTNPEEAREPGLAAFLRSLPPDIVPSPHSIDFAINFRDRTLEEILEILADRFHCDRDDLLKVLANRDQRTTLVFDSLEEAVEPDRIAELLLRPLTGYSHLWIIVGSRRPELPRLGGSLVVLDLDAPGAQHDAEVSTYVERILLSPDEPRRSPYRDNSDAAQRAALAVAEAANGNFLVAFIVARSLLERTAVLDTDHEHLPRTTEEAFGEYLHRLGERSGLGYGKLRRAILPLAYGQGSGLPRNVWWRLTDVNVDNLLHLAAAFIPAYEDTGHIVYRLYHPALAESLREVKDEAQEHQEIADVLLHNVPEGDWFKADWYTRKYFSIHAAKAGQLDSFLLDTKFLAAADPGPLLGVVQHAQSDLGARRAQWYKLAASRFHGGDSGERLRNLELTALQTGARNLWDSTQFDIPSKWKPRWANWGRLTPHLIVGLNISRENNGWLGSVGVWYDTALALMDGILIAANDEETVLWEARTGHRLEESIYSLPPACCLAVDRNLLALGQRDGSVVLWSRISGRVQRVVLENLDSQLTAIALEGNVLITASEDDAIRVWNLRTGRQVGDPMQGHERLYSMCRVRAVALRNRVIASAGDDGTVRLWNPEISAQICPPLRGHEGPVRNITIVDRTLVSGGDDGTLRFWDVRDGHELNGPLLAHGGTVTGLAAAKAGTILSCGSDGLIRIWDIDSRREIREPLVGHSSAIYRLSVHGELAASLGFDGIRLWDFKTSVSVGPSNRPDWNWIVTSWLAGDELITVSRDQTWQSWSKVTGRLLNERKVAFHATGIFIRNNSVAFSADRGVGVARLDNGQLQFDFDIDREIDAFVLTADALMIRAGWEASFWDLSRGRELCAPFGSFGLDHVAAFTKEGQVVVAALERAVSIRDVKTGRFVARPLVIGETPTAYASHGATLVVGTLSGCIQIWVRETDFVLRYVFQAHSAAVRSVAVKDRVLVSSDNNTAKLWTLGDSDPIQVAEEAGSRHIATDGRLVALDVGDGIRVRVAQNGKLVSRISRHDRTSGQSFADMSDPISLALEGDLLVSGLEPNGLQRWNARTGEAIGEPLTTDRMGSLALTEELIVYSCRQQGVRVWDRHTGEFIHAFGKEESVDGPAFLDHYGGTIVTFSGADVRLWHPDEGKPFHSYFVPVMHFTNLVAGGLIASLHDYINYSLIDFDPSGTISHIRFPIPGKITELEPADGLFEVQVAASNGHYCVLGCLDGAIRVFHSQTGRSLGAPYRGHRSSVTTVAIMDNLAISGSSDETVRFWDLHTGICLQVISLGSPVLEVTGDGGVIIVACSNGLCRIDLQEQLWKRQAL